jgi:peptidoglycan biosynthesis protein MviN/MurJ (putative lipid II flippase)
VDHSWDSARKHPTLTVVGLFVAGLVGVTLIAYLGPGGGALYASVATGVGCGLMLALLGWKATHDGSDVFSRVLRPATVFNLLTAGAGAALLTWGIVTLDASRALSGLPLLAFGTTLMLARHLLNQRGR